MARRHLKEFIKHLIRRDVNPRKARGMERQHVEVVGMRLTGWAALDRDPQRDVIEFTCPNCGAQDHKKARRERTEYKFTDGFLQDLQGEATQCHTCKHSLRVVPVVMLHDQEEKRRFEAVFAEEPPVIAP